MKTTVLLTIMMLALSCSQQKEHTYKNPLTGVSLPDPSIIKSDDGYFYLYATEDIRNTPIFRSKNLTDWHHIGECFTKETRPSWGSEEAGIWAPDINHINGKYVLYYTHAAPYCHETCGIGVAISDSPCGPFTDLGPLIQSDSIGVKNSIDQFYIEDSGKKYLIFGSFEGIYIIELTSDGLALQEGSEKEQIVGGGYEASNILKKGKHYYYFSSIDGCCAGSESTYKISVGRSDNLFGPYLNKSGESMMNFRPNVILHGDSIFAGPGHNSEIITDDSGDDWLLYHSFIKSSPEKGRVLCLDKIVWKEEWPEIEGSVPSKESRVPVFMNDK
ncbi:MAG: family 43 glycosylhydrolase [Dysgonamonadaceae bacterium]|jgi:beta-xylosidase|nr:family 43 glycosylhydrolase [Dysgonamonadaceae bacterium]